MDADAIAAYRVKRNEYERLSYAKRIKRQSDAGSAFTGSLE